jgi:hypothetical protein
MAGVMEEKGRKEMHKKVGAENHKQGVDQKLSPTQNDRDGDGNRNNGGEQSTLYAQIHALVVSKNDKREEEKIIPYGHCYVDGRFRL